MEELIKCLGVVTDNISIPVFELKEGEYLTIEIPFNYDSSCEKSLIEIFSGSKIIDGFQGNSKLEFADNIELRRGIFNWRKNSTSYRYLTKHAGCNEDEVSKILSKVKISRNDNILHLGYNQRKLLAFEIALLKSKIIAINTMGMDYLGLQTLRENIIKASNRGYSIIELNYKTNRGFESFEDSKIIRLSLLDQK